MRRSCLISCLIIVFAGGCQAAGSDLDLGVNPDASPDSIKDFEGYDAGDASACEPQVVATPIASKFATVNGSGFLYTENPNAKGLVLMFHGINGSKESNFENRIEAILIAKTALARGYAVAALDSAAHLAGENVENYAWDEAGYDANADVQNVVQMIAMLRGELAAVPSDTPIFLLGFSNGGTMASNVSQHVDVAAAAIYISNAKAFVSASAKVPPVMLLPSENDPGKALTTATTIQKLHPHTVVAVNPARAITPGIFGRIPGIDCAGSMGIGDALRSGGFIDATGFVLADPAAKLSWTASVPTAFRSSARLKQLRDVLLERYAGHSPSSDSAGEVFDFFDSIE